MFRIKQTESQLTIYEIPIFGWLIWAFMILMGSANLLVFRVNDFGPFLASIASLGMGIYFLAKTPLSIIEFDKGFHALFIRRYYIWGVRSERHLFEDLKNIRIEQFASRGATMYRLDMELSDDKHFSLTKSVTSSLEDHKRIVRAIYFFLEREIPSFAESH